MHGALVKQRPMIGRTCPCRLTAPDPEEALGKPIVAAIDATVAVYAVSSTLVLPRLTVNMLKPVSLL